MTAATPMLRQYLGLKAEYPDAILFFRMGDFYEMFFEDAKNAAKLLGITLTARGTHNGEKVPMCGVPHHAARSYIGKLVRNGLKVAICEQMEEPAESKGIVEREVVRVVTPGSVIDEEALDPKDNLHMAALTGGHGPYGLASVDLSTGDFRVTEVGEWEQVLDELGRINPAELLLLDQEDLWKQKALARFRQEKLSSGAYDPLQSEEILKGQLGVRSLDGFGCGGMTSGISAAGALVHYLKETQKGNPEHIKDMAVYRLSESMFLDEATFSHLELLRTMRRHSVKGSLFQELDATVTLMGSRRLKRWISYPLTDLDEIRDRLGAVACFKEDMALREEIRASLKEVYDLERLNGRVAMGRANGRDLLSLKHSALKLPGIKERLAGAPSPRLSECALRLDTLEDIARLIEAAIDEACPVTIREGGVIKEGYDPALDRLISLSRDGKHWINDFAASEQARTGIPNLKVGFNRVFGYYIEISNSNRHLVPQDYVRKQTLVNGERYITESLKTMEDQVLGAEERRVSLEYEIFNSVRDQIAAHHRRVRETAAVIAEIDVLCGLAEVAERNHYTCPDVNEGPEIAITEGRHPVIEQTVREEDFVPNDILLNDTDQQMLLITGPNMAGKSTVLRQTALTVLMAQIGSFVPARKAVIGRVDRIFTRVGASDDLARGQSTFMVEMQETANILRYATPASLVILDEIGRGTSTYDGLSLAWAVSEALHDRDGKGVRTLFATHYHELTEMAAVKPRVKNFNIAVKEWADRIIFLRKLVPGGTNRSYGIQVARIAGLPEDVLKRAKEILENLENLEWDGTGRPRLARTKEKRPTRETVQMSLFTARESELMERIRDLNIQSMTPLEAMIELDRLKQWVEAMP